MADIDSGGRRGVAVIQEEAIEIPPLKRAETLPVEAWGGLRAELPALLLLLALVLPERIYRLASLEPNLIGDEADHLRFLYRFMAGSGPGPFDLAWDGNPAASLFPVLPFLAAFGPGYVSLRLSTAVGSLVALVAFYLAVRQTLRPIPALAATALLGGSSWYLFFSRNGEVNVWAVAAMLLAYTSVELARRKGSLRYWLLAGLFCGVGWYTYLAGIFTLPLLLVYLALLTLSGRIPRAAALRGVAIMTALTLLLLAPRIGPLTQERSRVQEYVGIRSVLRGSPPERWPAILSNQFSVAFRAYLLFDPTLESGNPRYLEPGAPVLDSLTGTLYVVGLVFGVIHWRQTIFWWLLLLLFVFVIQGVSIYTPDGARAIPGLPAIALFAGLTIDRLLARERAFLFVLLGILVAVPSTMWWNWQHYAAWQQRPANAVARQPAVDPAEFPVWQAVQLERVRAGEPTYSVTEWKDVRGRYAVPAAVGGGPAPVASSVEVQPLVDFGPRTGLRQPRGVALAADGSAYVLDGDGRILQLNADGRQVAQLGQRTGGPSTGEPSDLAIGPDGSLYLLDAGRGVLDRYGPDGRFKETLGKEWAMYRPRGVGIGPDGLLYLADTGRDRVVVADGPRQLRAIPDLNQPTDIAVDAAGQLYVAQPDRGRVSVLDRDGRQSASWEIARGNTVEGPHLAFLEQGALAMTDPANKRLVFFDPAGHEIGSFAADGDLGFNAPYAVAALAERLLVVDSARPAIRAFDLSAR